MAKSKNTKKKMNYLFDGVRGDYYIRCWKESHEYMVQVWLSGKCEGEPDGDWAMPKMFGAEGSIEQSVLNTKSEKA